MKKILFLFLVFSSFVFIQAAFAEVENSYQQNMQYDLVRSVKNILGAPLEIPYTMNNYRESQQRPVIRETAGFFSGVFRMISREGSGMADFLCAFMPGNQEGFPVTPETLF